MRGNTCRPAMYPVATRRARGAAALFRSASSRVTSHRNSYENRPHWLTPWGRMFVMNTLPGGQSGASYIGDVILLPVRVAGVPAQADEPTGYQSPAGWLAPPRRSYAGRA
jgi:hypothetical protein